MNEYIYVCEFTIILDESKVGENIIVRPYVLYIFYFVRKNTYNTRMLTVCVPYVAINTLCHTHTTGEMPVNN